MGSFFSKVTTKKAIAFLLVSGGSVAIFILFYFRTKRPSITREPNNTSNGNLASSTSVVPPAQSPTIQLKGLRIILYTNEILLRKEDKTFSLIYPALESLRTIAPINDVYLITKVKNDEEESQVTQLLSEQNLSINPLKFLFCETDEGRAHVTRQLDGHVHIDNDLTVLTLLKLHVSLLVYINSMPEEETSHVKTFPTLDDFVQQHKSK